MRGAHHLQDGDPPRTRIIPADAGSTSPKILQEQLIGDHPRGCGEHATTTGQKTLTMGSSPRMRGALDVMAYAEFFQRIIPADAGSTLSPRSSAILLGDHPRGCGEHSRLTCPSCHAPGSSPRMREAPKLHGLLRRHVRIIPADAGSTRSV